jgi:hypothetical protein
MNLIDPGVRQFPGHGHLVMMIPFSNLALPFQMSAD